MAGYDARIRVMLQATEALNGLNKIEEKIRRITEATQNQALKVNLPKQYKDLVKNTEKALTYQLRLNSATSLFERRLVQINRAGGLRTESQRKELALTQKIAGQHGNNLRLMEAIASTAGKLLETVRETNREDKRQNQLRRELYTYEQQIQALAEQGLKQSEINKLIKSRAILDQQIQNRQLDLAEITNDRLKQQIKLKNRKFEELEITKRISAEEKKALQTAGLRLRALAKSIDSIINKANRIPGAGPGGQLALPPAKPGSPAMSGGARRRVSGNTEILGGGRSVQEAAQTLFMAERFPGTSPIISPIGTPPDRITEPRRRSQAELEEAASIARSARIARERSAFLLGQPGPQGLIGPIQRPADFPVATPTTQIQKELDLRQKINLAIDAQLQKEQQRLKFLQGATQYSSPAGPSDVRRRQFQESVAGLRRIRGEGGSKLPPNPKRAGLRKGLTQFADFGLGAGFPLLFGGGAGQVAGGGIGTALGKSLGLASQAVFGLQIAFSAIGDQIEQAVRRVQEFGQALQTLDLDRLAATTVRVDEALRSQVRTLVEAGKFAEAYAVASEEVAKQTGISAQFTEDLSQLTTNTGNSWNEFTTAVSATLSILASPFLSALDAILQVSTLVLKTFNGFVEKIANLIYLIPGVKQALEFLREITFQTTEEQAKQIDLLKQQAEQSNKQVSYLQQNVALERERTLALDDAGKLTNIEVNRRQALLDLDKQVSDEQKEINTKVARVGKLRGKAKRELEETVQVLQQNLDKQTEEQKKLIEINTARETALTLIKGGNEELSKRTTRLKEEFNLQKAATDLVKAQATLDIQRSNRIIETTQSTLTARAEYNNIYRATVALADADYKIGVANLRLEESKLEALIAQSKIQESLLRAKIQEYKTNAAVAGIYQEALRFQQDATSEAYRQLDAMIASNDIRQRALKIQRQATVEAAEHTRNMNIASLSTKKTATNMGKVATATGQAAKESGMFANNMERAANAASRTTKSVRAQTVVLSGSIGIKGASKEAIAKAGGTEQFNDFMMRGKSPLTYLREWNRFADKVLQIDKELIASGATRTPAYASGGYVSSPTNAVIGEGGSEYVIPASKMAAAMKRYASGKRGEAVVPNGNDAQVNVSTGPVMQMNGQNYVTQSDFEKGLRSTVSQVMTSLRRSPNTRSSVGI